MSQWQKSNPNNHDCRNAECEKADYYMVVCSGQRRGRLAAWSLQGSRISRVRRGGNKESPISEYSPRVSGLKTLKVVDWCIWGTKQMWLLLTSGLIGFCTSCLIESFKHAAAVKRGTGFCLSVIETWATVLVAKVHFILWKFLLLIDPSALTLWSTLSSLVSKGQGETHMSIRQNHLNCCITLMLWHMPLEGGQEQCLLINRTYLGLSWEARR